MAELTVLINMAGDADRVLQDPRQCEEEELELDQDDVLLSDFQNSLIEREKSCLPTNDRQCIVCSKYFVSAEATRSHFETYHDNTLFECRFCRLTFMLKSNLQIHHTKHHCRDHTKLKTADQKLMSCSSGKNGGHVLDQDEHDVIHKDANNGEDPELNSPHWNCINGSTTEKVSHSNGAEDANDEQPNKVHTDDGTVDLNGYGSSNTAKHLTSGTQEESEKYISIDLSSSNSPLTHSHNLATKESELEDIKKENNAPIAPISPDDRSQFTQSGTIDESINKTNVKEDLFTDATTTIQQEGIQQEGKFWCKTCNISFKKKIYLNRHSLYSLTHKKHITNPKSIINRVPCITCGSTFANKKSLKTHQRVICRKRIEGLILPNSSEALGIENINLTENSNSKQLEQVAIDNTITKQMEIDAKKETKQIETESNTESKGNESQTISSKGIEPVIETPLETPNMTTVSRKEEAEFNVNNQHQLREITIPCIRIDNLSKNVGVPVGFDKFDYNQANGSISVRDGGAAIDNCVSNIADMKKHKGPKAKEGGSKRPSSIVVQNISNDDIVKPDTSKGNGESGSKAPISNVVENTSDNNTLSDITETELDRPNGEPQGQTGTVVENVSNDNNKDRQSPDWDMILQYLHQCQESETVHTEEKGPAFEDSFTETPKRIRRYIPALCDGCGVTFSSKSSCKRHKVKSCKGYGNNLPLKAKSKRKVLKDQSPNKLNMGSETLMADEENISSQVNLPLKNKENQTESLGLCLPSNDPFKTVEIKKRSSKNGNEQSPVTEQRILAACQRPCPKSKKKFFHSNASCPIDRSRTPAENKIKQSNQSTENKKSGNNLCDRPCPQSKKRFRQEENSVKGIPISDENVSNLDGVVPPCSKIKKTSSTDDEEGSVPHRTTTNQKPCLNGNEKTLAIKETTSIGGFQKPCPKSKKKFYMGDLGEASNKPIIQSQETTNQRTPVSLSQTYQQPCAKDQNFIPHIQHESDKDSSEDTTPITDTTSKNKLKAETMYQRFYAGIKKVQEKDQEASHPKIASVNTVIHKRLNLAFKPGTYQKPCPKSKKKFNVDDLKDDVLILNETAKSLPESEKFKSTDIEKERKEGLTRIGAYQKPCPKTKKKFHLNSLETAALFEDNQVKDTKARMKPYQKPCPKSKKKFYVDDLKDDVLGLDGTTKSLPEGEKFKSVDSEKERMDLIRIGTFQKPCPKSKKKSHLNSLETAVLFKDNQVKDTKAQKKPYQKPCPKSKKKFYVDDLNDNVLGLDETAKSLPESKKFKSVDSEKERTDLKRIGAYQKPCPKSKKKFHLEELKGKSLKSLKTVVDDQAKDTKAQIKSYQKPCPKSKNKFYADDLKDDVLGLDGTTKALLESEKYKSVDSEKERMDQKPCPKSKKKYHLDELKGNSLKSLETAVDGQAKDTKAQMKPYQKPCPKSKKKFYHEIENFEDEGNVCPNLIREDKSLVSEVDKENGHMPKLRITCNICGRQFPRRSQCMIHMMQVHSKRPKKFRCSDSQPTPRVDMGSRKEEEESDQ